MRWILLLGLGLPLVLFSCQIGVREPRHPGWSEAGISKMSGEIEVRGERIEEQRAGANGSVDLSETRFREEIGLAMAGFYYHPKFLEFDLGGTFGLEQREIKSSGALPLNTVNGQNISYDLSARLFKDLPYGGEFYTNRAETRTRQTFFETNEAVISDSGLRAFANGWWMPSELQMNHHSYVGRGINDYSETRDTLRLEGRRDDDNLQLQYLAEYNDVNLGNFGEPFEDFSFNASGTSSFGKDNRSRVFSGVFVRRQWGSNDNSNLNWNNSLDFQMTENLKSRAEVQYAETERGQDSTQTITATTGLSHQLFLSLNSSVDGRWSRSTFGAGDVGTWGLRGAVNYTKKTPIGRLGVQQVLDTYFQNRGALQGTATAVGEIHVFDPAVPLFLDSIAINPLTVVVHDSNGITVYRRGVDYFVVTVGPRTRIDIPVSSLISPGDTLLIDYDFQPTPEQEVNTFTSTTVFTLGVPEKVDFTLGRSSVGQNLVSGFDDGTLEESTRTYADARYYPWEETTIGLDFEDYVSNIAPFTRLNLQVDQRIPLFQSLEWQAAANTYHISFSDEGRSEYGSSANTSVIAYLGTSTQVSATAEAHRATLRTDRGNGFLLELDFRHYFGRTLASFNARLVDENFDIADDQRLLNLTLSFTRYF